MGFSGIIRKSSKNNLNYIIRMEVTLKLSRVHKKRVGCKKKLSKPYEEILS